MQTIKKYIIQLVILASILLLALIPDRTFPNSNSFNYSQSKDTIDPFMPTDTLDSLMWHYDQEGYNYMLTGNYDQANIFLNKSLEIKKIRLSETDIQLGNSYVNLGVLYLQTWRFDDALRCYREAEQIYRRIDSNYINLGSVYVNEAIIYKHYGDYDKAKSFINNAIRIFSSRQQINYNLLKIAYYNLGNIEYNAGSYDQAINAYTRGKFYNSGNDTIDILLAFTSIALCYNSLNKDSLAQKYYKSTIELAQAYYGENHPQNASYLMNYGIFLIEKLGKYEEGRKLYDISLNMYKEREENKGEETSRCLYNIGEYYFIYLDNIDNSLRYLQESLIYAEPDFDDISIYVNPELSTNRLNRRLLESLKLKGRVLLESYRKNGRIRDLNASLETYDLVIQNIDKIRGRYNDEESRFIFSRQQYELFIQAITVANLLYNLTNNLTYLQKSLEYNEKAKAFSLLISLRNLKAKQFGGLPIELLDKEKDLSRQLALYEERIFEEKRKGQNQDKVKLDLWEERLFWLKQQNEQLLHHFEQTYPQYYELKYNTKVISINEIINSLNNETLIEYTIADTLLFIHVFNKGKSNLISTKIDSSFYDNIRYIRDFHNEPSFSNNAKLTYEKFCKASYQLYQTLIGSCNSTILDNSLIIIPDGMLSYVPFESLITYPVYTNTANYRNLPYLVRDHAISYAYSASLLLETQNQKSIANEGLLAFAPDYSNFLDSSISYIEKGYLDSYRENLVPIPGVKDEVKMISRQIDGEVFTDEEATESNFKQNAEFFDILHLAMHTIIDNRDPMYSNLAFTQDVDAIEDGFLNTYEIYNMHFNARMAVLSSCKSGVGKLMKGEGVMSLARGFMYAGCPSIVMTLWEVSDKSGARLMEDFYKSLKRGRSKAEALREAKLDFLKNADNLKANPYFWSTYVVIGDSSPLFKKNLSYLYWLAAILLIAAGGLLYYIRRQRIIKGREAFKPDSLLS